MNENSAYIVSNKKIQINDGNHTLTSYNNGKFLNNGYIDGDLGMLTMNGDEDLVYSDSDTSIFVRVCITDQNVQVHITEPGCLRLNLALTLFCFWFHRKC